jgi:hypothetical protein
MEPACAHAGPYDAEAAAPGRSCGLSPQRARRVARKIECLSSILLHAVFDVLSNPMRRQQSRGASPRPFEAGMSEPLGLRRSSPRQTERRSGPAPLGWLLGLTRPSLMGAVGATLIAVGSRWAPTGATTAPRGADTSSKAAHRCCIEGKCGGRLGSKARGGPEDLTRRFIPTCPSQRCWKSCDAPGFPSRAVERSRFRAPPATPDMTMVPRIVARTSLDEPASEGCWGGPARPQRGYPVRHRWRERPRSRSPSGHRTGESATWA